MELFKKLTRQVKIDGISLTKGDELVRRCGHVSIIKNALTRSRRRAADKIRRLIRQKIKARPDHTTAARVRGVKADFQDHIGSDDLVFTIHKRIARDYPSTVITGMHKPPYKIISIILGRLKSGRNLRNTKLIIPDDGITDSRGFDCCGG